MDLMSGLGSSLRRKWQPTPVFLPGKFHGQRSLVGYSPWGSQRVGDAWANTHTYTSSWIERCNILKMVIIPKLIYTFNLTVWKSLLPSFQFSRVRLFATPWTAAHQAFRPSPTPGACSNSCPLSHWCHPTISSSVIPSSLIFNLSQHQSLFVSQFFTSGSQSIGVSASASVLPMNIQGWFPLGCTGWTSLQSKRLLRVFSNTTVQKHQFFGTKLSL